MKRYLLRVKNELKSTFKLAINKCLALKNFSICVSLVGATPFLGLKDKFGRLIMWGDILVDEQGTYLTPVCEVENGEHALFFKPIQHLDKNYAIGCKSTYSTTLRVVGNVYAENQNDRFLDKSLLAKKCCQERFLLINISCNN